MSQANVVLELQIYVDLNKNEHAEMNFAYFSFRIQTSLEIKFNAKKYCITKIPS